MIRIKVLSLILVTVVAITVASAPSIPASKCAVNPDTPEGCYGCAKTGRDHGSCEFCRGYEHVYQRTHDAQGNLIGYIDDNGAFVVLR